MTAGPKRQIEVSISAVLVSRSKDDAFRDAHAKMEEHLKGCTFDDFTIREVGGPTQSDAERLRDLAAIWQAEGRKDGAHQLRQIADRMETHA